MLYLIEWGEEPNAMLCNACYGLFKANNPIDALEQAKKEIRSADAYISILEINHNTINYIVKSVIVDDDTLFDFLTMVIDNALAN
jgi:hypothetical protein